MLRYSARKSCLTCRLLSLRTSRLFLLQHVFLSTYRCMHPIYSKLRDSISLKACLQSGKPPCTRLLSYRNTSTFPPQLSDFRIDSWSSSESIITQRPQNRKATSSSRTGPRIDEQAQKYPGFTIDWPSTLPLSGSADTGSSGAGRFSAYPAGIHTLAPSRTSRFRPVYPAPAHKWSWVQLKKEEGDASGQASERRGGSGRSSLRRLGGLTDRGPNADPSKPASHKRNLRPRAENSPPPRSVLGSPSRNTPSSTYSTPQTTIFYIQKDPGSRASDPRGSPDARYMEWLDDFYTQAYKKSGRASELITEPPGARNSDPLRPLPASACHPTPFEEAGDGAPFGVVSAATDGEAHQMRRQMMEECWTATIEYSGSSGSDLSSDSSSSDGSSDDAGPSNADPSGAGPRSQPPEQASHPAKRLRAGSPSVSSPGAPP